MEGDEDSYHCFGCIRPGKLGASMARRGHFCISGRNSQSPVKLLRIIELDAKSAIPNSGGTKSHPPQAERSVEDLDGASVAVVADQQGREPRLYRRKNLPCR